MQLSNVVGAPPFGAMNAPARWRHGTCEGTLTLQRSNSITSSSSSSESLFCVLVSTTLTGYESLLCFQRGDAPVCRYVIVGATITTTTTTTCRTTTQKASNLSFRHTPDLTFRIVSQQGSHLLCHAPTLPCRNVWLQALQQGLGQALVRDAVPGGGVAAPVSSSSSPRNNNATSCALCTKRTVPHTNTAIPTTMHESKVEVCGHCHGAQELVHHVQTLHAWWQYTHEQNVALHNAKRAMMELFGAVVVAAHDNHATTENNGTDDGSWAHVAHDDDDDATSPSRGSRSTPSPPSDWIHLSPSSENTQALLDLVNSVAFAPLLQASPQLHAWVTSWKDGHIHVNELLELVCGDEEEEDNDHDDGVLSPSKQQLQTQAFQMIDMATALQILSDAKKRDLWPGLLNFILDNGDHHDDDTMRPAVAFFWPQLLQIHLQLLPPRHAMDARWVETYEDFIVTCCMDSVQLALHALWSHTADLHESSKATASVACRRRRCGVLRFVAELESLLFDHEGGWGGGAMTVGPYLQATALQLDVLRDTMASIQTLRYHDSNAFALNRSFRRDRLRRHAWPEERILAEKVRVARHAEYFSSHWTFTRRICDVAEKLRHMELETRAAQLESELETLNASGAMGGDPLNRVRASLLRIVRIPSMEGHVFRSKERTPVLLLLETVDDDAMDGQEIVASAEDNGANAPDALAAPAVAEAATCENEGSTTPNRRRTFTDKSSGSYLEGAFDDSFEGKSASRSPKLTALKKFGTSSDISDDTMNASTPKRDVEKILTNVAVEQLSQELNLPDLSPTVASDTPNAAAPTPVAPSYASDTTPGGTDDEHVDEAFHDAEQSVLIEATESSFAVPQSDMMSNASNTLDPPAPVETVESSDEFSPTTGVTTAIADYMELSPETVERKDAVLTAMADPAPPSGVADAEIAESAAIASPEVAAAAAATEPGSVPLPFVPQSDDTSNRRASRSTTPTRQAAKRSSSGRVSALGSLSAATAAEAVGGSESTSDVRRDVLNAIMIRGFQGNTIAAGTADAVQRSLQELDRQRASALLAAVSCDDDVEVATSPQESVEASYVDLETTIQRMNSLGLQDASPRSEEEEQQQQQQRARPTEEDEAMEAVRLLLIQSRVATGQLSPADAAKVLQHSSLNRSSSDRRPQSPTSFGVDTPLDISEMPTIDAGDVDLRLVGCGPLPPAVLQALMLWKGGMVTNGELLELVKKDIEFVRHSVLLDAENVDKLQENSAFWGRFAFGERWAEKKARIAASSPESKAPGWDLMGVIVKSNDDLRQEAFIMQLVELCQEAFELADLELWVSPYRIVATGRTTGVIEMVRNAMSFDALKKRPGYGKGGLREHLLRMTEFTADPGGAFKAAQRNFVRSLAAYSLMSYFFMIKDRHNGNLLLDTAGHVIHIDFGFCFGDAPGGSFSLEMSTPFKLTEEMLDVMGGMRSSLFSEFVTLFCCGFLALQSHCETFLTVVEITSKDSTFKCFQGKTPAEVAGKLRERFVAELNKEETVAFALDIIKQATNSYGTKQYDMFQYLSQGIAA